MLIYAVVFCSADSYNSVSIVKALFTTEEKAKLWIDKQKGYGFGVDWFIKKMRLDPSDCK